MLAVRNRLGAMVRAGKLIQLPPRRRRAQGSVVHYVREHIRAVSRYRCEGTPLPEDPLPKLRNLGPSDISSGDRAASGR
jgi:hypothetical protein